MKTIEMKRYKSAEWNFALDIPNRWNAFPPVPANNPYEVIRFASREYGAHLLTVMREPHDPRMTLKQRSDQLKKLLAAKGFGNFTTTETAVNSRPALILDFNKFPYDVTAPLLLRGDRYVPMPDRLWSCRHYLLTDGTLAYTLGFGTTDKKGMFGLFERMAGTFQTVPE